MLPGLMRCALPLKPLAPPWADGIAASLLGGNPWV